MKKRQRGRNSINFTVASLDRADCPQGQSVQFYYDKKAPGLALAVTAAGGKAFYYYRWAFGKPLRVKLADYRDIQLDEARRLAHKISADIADGIDPTRQRRERRDGMTLDGLWELFFETHAKPHLRPSTRDGYANVYALHLKPWGRRKLADIDRGAVQVLHARIGRRAPAQANRLLALISKMFNMARAQGLATENPAQGVKRYRERSRTRFLNGDELRRFFEALKELPNPTARDFFLLALFTAARRGNVSAMKWGDIDLTAGTWTIPGDESKNGQPITVYLSAPCMAILRRRFDETGGAGFVFPGIGKTGHYTEPKKAWRMVCEAAALPDLRIHDLRRTFGSWQAIGGASLPIIGATLGHEAGSPATAVYARLSSDPVRQSVNSTTAAILAAAGGIDLTLEGPRDDETE